MDTPDTPPPAKSRHGLLILLVLAAVVALPLVWSMFSKDAANLRGTLISGERTGTEGAATPFNYSLSVSPASLIIAPGDSARATVTVTVTSGTPQEVRLGISEHAGITATFTPADRCTPSGEPATCSADFALVTSRDIAPGTVGLMVLGNGGRPGVLRDAPFTVTVTAAQ